MAETTTLKTLLDRVTGALNAEPTLRNVWVAAELSDFSQRYGHCYTELLEKDERGTIIARVRATIWTHVASRLIPQFERTTGQRLQSGIKVLVCVTIGFHPLYGLSANITNIDPSYTIGEKERRRREIISRLQQEGILEKNRGLEFPAVPQRIALLTSRQAAGCGDFLQHIFNTPSKILFDIHLYEVAVQGERTVTSIVEALERVKAEEMGKVDCVVIIRGGGGTSDLDVFDSYEIARAIALCPLPVMIGIGHDRDITVLDWVANVRTKTPTDAAAVLVEKIENYLSTLGALAEKVAHIARERVDASRQQLAAAEALLPLLPGSVIERQRVRLSRALTSVASVGQRIVAEQTRLDARRESLKPALENILTRQRQRLEGDERVLATLSPQATLSRGYSITLVNGKSVRRAADIPVGTLLETRLSDGTIISRTVTEQ